ncbi:hypothetical protein DVV91_08970 [Clostridium botulinum]|uniref:DEAD/DEAH box helicase family protein n=1 Tax=Clostridium botulinum TaxID=1491 RepID=UPI0013F767A0|nr:DEAD/DEAH box helicase family protein [Clostridium botulinum]MBN1074471.1 hypothetical protein [Clostridium botulinum]NFE61254.1 DEAD/DEAH box helicase [Clostridium botulinum]NFG11471.1 DEAD/DEAH box helicase [Clostridium botulinum]NFI51767.1 DEAD/DEAH box helicase [Clostridium botulinum]NFL57874.1 DEAD/DEAH box helicase [Clostridium botulinum]
MGFNNLNLKFKYRSENDKIYLDFYSKVMKEALRYDRAVGYFTSNSLRLIAKDLEEFVNKDGYIRIVANPHLSPEDVEAIERGYKAKEDLVIANLIKEVEIIEKNIEDNTLEVLSVLIHREILDIKIAFTKNNSLYHEKFGIFYDQYGERVAFSGSSNETIGGMKDNFEKIDVYFRKEDSFRIDDMENDFERLWDNNTSGLNVIELPDVLKEKIVKNRVNKKLEMGKKLVNIETREYQQEAIRSVKENNWNGILEMATGTGKTIISLLIANEFFKEQEKIFLIILVPFTHLVKQWEENCNELCFGSITKCYGEKKNWSNKLQTDVRDFNIGIIKKHVAISTYKSASAPEFNDLISKLRGKSFIIGDECHYFGIRSLKNHKFDGITAKLGLSATPDRWWDEEGTDYLRNFFGNTVYEYDMRTAIKNGALTEYKYNPIIVNLLNSEVEEYEKLTARLIRLLSSKQNIDQEEISKINRKRSLILSRASNKKQILFDMLEEHDKESISHTLIYCALGEVDIITNRISEMGIKVHRFDSKIDNSERSKVLAAFADGIIQILVAIKCLDEGVDVPSTRTAYFLASTSNPREFVQRRGRILRKYKGKNISTLYDFIVLPEGKSESVFRTIASKEIPRFAEFARYAINGYNARKIVGEKLKPYALEYLMDKLPWEVYKEFKKVKESGEYGYQ